MTGLKSFTYIQFHVLHYLCISLDLMYVCVCVCIYIYKPKFLQRIVTVNYSTDITELLSTSVTVLLQWVFEG